MIVCVNSGKKRNSPKEILKKELGCSRCYISRVENGHTIPSLETLEKLARSFEVPLYQRFYDGEAPPTVPKLLKRKTADGAAWGSTGKDSVYMYKLVKRLSRANEFDRQLVFAVAQKVSAERGRRVSKEK